MLAQELASQEQAPAGEPRKTDETVSTYEPDRRHAAAHDRPSGRQRDLAVPTEWSIPRQMAHASGSTGAVSTGCGGAHPTGFGVDRGVVTERSSSAGTVSSDWALISKLELGPLATAIGCGRDHARQVLREWGLGQLADDAVLLVSELLTNALKASQALRVPTPIVLRLLANDQQLIIEAWDSWVEGFDLQSRSSDDEHGRGLQVVAALSRRWGVGSISEQYKVVWCELLFERR